MKCKNETLTLRFCITGRILLKRKSDPFICDVQLLAGTVFDSEARASKHMKCVCLRVSTASFPHSFKQVSGSYYLTCNRASHRPAKSA